RHTRSDRDWSSDVCSSDLDRRPEPTQVREGEHACESDGERLLATAGEAGRQHAESDDREDHREHEQQDRERRRAEGDAEDELTEEEEQEELPASDEEPYQKLLDEHRREPSRSDEQPRHHAPGMLVVHPG